jgi:hypothetical protein
VEPKAWLNTTAKIEIPAPAGILKMDATLEATVHEVLDPEDKRHKHTSKRPVDKAQHLLKFHFRFAFFWDLTQRRVIISTDVSGNISIPSSREVRSLAFLIRSPSNL